MTEINITVEQDGNNITVEASNPIILVQEVGIRGPAGEPGTITGVFYISNVWRIRDNGAGNLNREFFDGSNWIVKGWDEV